MRKVDDGEKKKKKKKKKRKKKEKIGVFSGHYVIASSLPPEQRPLERCKLVPIQFPKNSIIFAPLLTPYLICPIHKSQFCNSLRNQSDL